VTAGGRGRATDLAVLTVAKTVANTALRWVGPFLPTLERAFGTSIGTLTTIMAVSEFGGLSTAPMGRVLDRGHQRRIFVAGLAAIAVSSLIALGGSVRWFALSFAVLVLGVTNLTVAGHAWISSRVPYSGRGRAIGVFELSWALGLCVGGPIIAVLINWFGWRGPFAALAVASAAAAVAVQVLVSDDITTRRAPRNERPSEPLDRLPLSAWPALFTSALVGGAGLGVFVISGAWLSDSYGVSTAGLGLVVAGFGVLELAASGASAAFSDRVGKRRSVAVGIAGLVCGLAITATAGGSLLVAVIGLTVFLTGFEYAFVTSLSLVSEAAPAARGRALGVGNSLGTLARSASIFASGQLYESIGIGGPLVMSAGIAVAAFAMVLISRRT
jgi:MFS transporter, DHA1 family, inner membrane transport protein